MRIGIDGRALQGKLWSGVGQYTYHLLHALFASDKENEYVVWYNGFGKIAAPDFSPYPNVRIRRTHWPNKILNLAFKAKLYTMAQSLALYNVKVFFMPNPNFFALPLGIKLVTVVHDLSFEHFSEHFSWKSRLWHRAVNPRALFQRADRIIAVSGHTKQDLVETYGISEGKITVVYPGVNDCHPERSEGSLTDVSLHTQEIPRFARNDKLGNYILYFGALEPRKNILGIIEAYEGLRPRAPLVLAGLSTAYAKHLKKRIAKSKVKEKITLIENPTEEEKHALYAGAALFVYPSFYEGFGFPPLEAMSAGVPVVASSAGAVPEICGNAAMLVSPWRVLEIKEGMCVLLEDEVLRATYREAGLRRIKDFTWEKCAEQAYAIFQVAG